MAKVTVQDLRRLDKPIAVQRRLPGQGVELGRVPAREVTTQ